MSLRGTPEIIEMYAICYREKAGGLRWLDASEGHDCEHIGFYNYFNPAYCLTNLDSLSYWKKRLAQWSFEWMVEVFEVKKTEIRGFGKWVEHNDLVGVRATPGKPLTKVEGSSDGS